MIEMKGYRIPFTLKVSSTRQLRLIRELISKADIESKSGKRKLLADIEKLEPITAYNRLRTSELFLTKKKLVPLLALKVIERGRRYGEEHPLIDYHRVLALWLLGPSEAALQEALKVAKRWNFSANIAMVGYIYKFLGQAKIGDQWI